MKIQILSDLHQEFGFNPISFKNADLIIFAGDINIGTRGIDWMRKDLANKKIIYVLGNHEYYKGAYPKTLDKIREASKNSNINVLENDSVIIGDITFHGATLWTNFSLYGSPREYGVICQTQMSDYKNIKLSPSYSKLRSIDTYRIHNKSFTWLDQSLKNSTTKYNIVITHHAPSSKSLPEKYKNDPVSSAYASNLEELITEHGPNYWIHGHIHSPTRYKIRNTEIICNPHGYIDEKCNGYEKELIIEL